MDKTLKRTSLMAAVAFAVFAAGSAALAALPKRATWLEAALQNKRISCAFHGAAFHGAQSVETRLAFSSKEGLDRQPIKVGELVASFKLTPKSTLAFESGTENDRLAEKVLVAIELSDGENTFYRRRAIAANVSYLPQRLLFRTDQHFIKMSCSIL